MDKANDHFSLLAAAAEIAAKRARGLGARSAAETVFQVFVGAAPLRQAQAIVVPLALPPGCKLGPGKSRAIAQPSRGTVDAQARWRKRGGRPSSELEAERR